MTQALLKLLLGPLLLHQARGVRRHMPRLPEAEGPRTGHRGDGTALRLLLVGDSAAAGVGVASQAEALSGQLVARLCTHMSVDWQLSARPGLTTADIAERMACEKGHRCDVAVVSAGVNDVTSRCDEREWIQAMTRLVETLRSRHGARCILLAPLPPMHCFPALPQPLRLYLGLRARAFNRQLHAFAQPQPDCRLLELDFGFDTRLMASDGFHPGAAAYALWAQAAATQVLQWTNENRDGAQR